MLRNQVFFSCLISSQYKQLFQCIYFFVFFFLNSKMYNINKHFPIHPPQVFPALNPYIYKVFFLSNSFSSCPSIHRGGSVTVWKQQGHHRGTATPTQKEALYTHTACTSWDQRACMDWGGGRNRGGALIRSHSKESHIGMSADCPFTKLPATTSVI